MAKKLGLVLGVVFLLVGLLGFVSNPIVGDMGIFHTNGGHSLVHIITGLLFIFVALKATNSTGIVLKVFGIVYLLVAILGFVMLGSQESVSLLGFIDVNSADNYLHVILAVVVFAAGMMAGKKQTMMNGGMM